MIRILYLLSICLVFVSCNKEGDNKENQDKDWNVRYEVTSSGTNPQTYIQWTNGIDTYYTGTTSNNAAWPRTPWIKDTVYKSVDGDRIIKLNVVYVLGGAEKDVISRIYVNGMKVKEGIGMNQFITTGLK